MTKKMKSVSKEEFYKFVKYYPKTLQLDIDNISSPPRVTYNDLSLGKSPHNVIASCVKNDYLKNEVEHDFKIIDNPSLVENCI